MAHSGRGHIPLGLDNGLSVHVAILGAVELNASDGGDLGGQFWHIGITCRRISQSCEACCSVKDGVRRTRKLHEFATALGNGKLEAINFDLVCRS